MPDGAAGTGAAWRAVVPPRARCASGMCRCWSAEETTVEIDAINVWQCAGTGRP